MFYCLISKVFKNTFIVKVCVRQFLKIKVSAGVSFCKVSGFFYKQNVQYNLKEQRHIFPWKFPNL